MYSGSDKYFLGHFLLKMYIFLENFMISPRCNLEIFTEHIRHSLLKTQPQICDIFKGVGSLKV